METILSTNKKYYFIGIKGSGMASLALMLHNLGYDVLGSDLDKHFFTEDELIKQNIKILSFNAENIKDDYIVIIGNAFLDDFVEVKQALSNPTCKCYRYHEFLGLFMKSYYAITVSGSHGKTTTTTMLKTMLSSFKPTGYLIGDGQGFINKKSELLCVEACEFNRHFLAYYPRIGIITNIEIDHVDYFKDEDDYFSAYQSFVDNIQDLVVYYGDDVWCQKLKLSCQGISFGFDITNDYVIETLKEENNCTYLNLKHQDKTFNFVLPFIGKHLIIDAISVIIVGLYFNFDINDIALSFNNYVGPKRRYVIENINNSVIIDDYAHHPTEVKLTIEATLKRYPNKKVIAIFKPHRASRVKYFMQDFKEALSLANYAYLLDFTSIDDNQDGTVISINDLAKIIDNCQVISEDDKAAEILSRHQEGVYLFMSSKDIYHLEDKLKKLL